MSCQCSIDADLCGFQRPGFSHKDDIRIVSENGFHTDFVCISLSVVDLRLLDAGNLILDRIFQGNDLLFPIIEIAEDRIECRRLSASCGSGKDDDAGIFLQMLLEQIVGLAFES
jgi:hypothetical protein